MAEAYFGENPSLWTTRLELLSKLCAVATAAAIPCSTTMTDILFVLTVILNFAAGNIKVKLQFILQNKVALSLLIFFAMFIVGMSYTVVPIGDALKILGKYDKFLWGALLFPVFVEEKWRLRAIYGFMVVILLMLFLSYMKAFGILHYDMGEGPIEVFRNHIQFNFLMAIGAYFLLLNIVRVKKANWRLLSLILFLLITYNVFFLSEGRSGYVVFGVIFVLFFVQHYRWRGLFLSIPALLILGSLAFLYSSAFHERIDYMKNEVNTYNINPVTSVGTRIEALQNSIKLVKQHPIFGTGTGSFIYEYAHIKPTPHALVHNTFNEYLYVGVQFGLLGMLLLLAMFGVQLWYGILLPNDMKYISQAIILSIMAGSFANSWLLDTTEGHLYTFFIALTFASLESKSLLLKKKMQDSVIAE